MKSGKPTPTFTFVRAKMWGRPPSLAHSKTMPQFMDDILWNISFLWNIKNWDNFLTVRMKIPRVFLCQKLSKMASVHEQYCWCCFFVSFFVWICIMPILEAMTLQQITFTWQHSQSCCERAKQVPNLSVPKIFEAEAKNYWKISF